MKKKFLGLLFVLSGVGLVIGAFVIEAAWLAFIFGTVVIGVLMLFLTPLLVMAPFFFLFGTGTTLLSSGMLMISNDD
jgi:hypothetical protein